MQRSLVEVLGDRAVVPVTEACLLEELRLELVILLMQFRKTRQTDFLAYLVHLLLDGQVFAVQLLREIQVVVAILCACGLSLVALTILIKSVVPTSPSSLFLKLIYSYPLTNVSRRLLLF